MPETEKALDLRVVLEGSTPEIWRTLRVPASARLNDLHEAIQRAFGWENRHLHLFHPEGASGQARTIAGDSDSADELGLESAVGMAMTELLSSEGSWLEYEYDLGDSWIHLVEVAGHALAPAGQICCLDGANRGPLEDAGGIGGYEEKRDILADPTGPDYADIADWYEYVTGLSAKNFDPAEFDLEAVNRSLARLSLQLAESTPTPEERAAVVRPVRWLLERARPDGLELTKDGYLKPALVQETIVALGWEEPWCGSMNRESQAPDVARLRGQLQEWKLLRKYKGRLLPAPAARKTYDDDSALWDYLTARLASPGNLALEVGMGVLVWWLLNDRVPTYMQVGEAMAGALVQSGLRPADGGPVTEADGRAIYYELWHQLSTLGIFEQHLAVLTPSVPTAAGTKFLLHLNRQLAYSVTG
ncbi:plasmid pRiA4b ORF-3 family protein [Arthrobacter sp. I2-34]|uniref:Plasmid pRiA4b ORF-3 family protein n=1 Tax=Arthrobacter hankyongi TaxID=2904801 RepID=A0ABS9L2F5_9MICC|nr:plasmid pRiA4b ORF-3 family protein [Arthrobacter hankyongi]MCG2620877.1 plasmid pRiA4b ORF-3 family protein [Arthrobacter hankyongi]